MFVFIWFCFFLTPNIYVYWLHVFWTSRFLTLYQLYVTEWESLSFFLKKNRGISFITKYRKLLLSYFDMLMDQFVNQCLKLEFSGQWVSLSFFPHTIEVYQLLHCHRKDSLFSHLFTLCQNVLYFLWSLNGNGFHFISFKFCMRTIYICALTLNDELWIVWRKKGDGPISNNHSVTTAQSIHFYSFLSNSVIFLPLFYYACHFFPHFSSIVILYIVFFSIYFLNSKKACRTKDQKSWKKLIVLWIVLK